MPGGFKDCSLTLARRIDVDYPDLNLLDDVRVYGSGNETLWEGRVAAIPRSHGDDTTITVQCVGHAAHLRDDTSFKEIYVDRDLTHWGEPSLQRQANRRAASDRYVGDVSVTTDATTGVPGLAMSLNRVFPQSLLVEAWYNGLGCPIASVYYDVLNYDNGTLNNMAAVSWTVEVFLNQDDVGTGGSGTGDLLPNPDNGYHTPSGTGFKFASLEFRWPSTAVTADGDWAVHWRRLAIWGTHGLTKQGTAPADGVYASDVIANVLSRAAPLLNYTTGAGGSIESTTFVIPQLEFREPTTAEDAILAVNAYHLYEWGVYDDKKFFFRAPDPDRLCWEARLSEGAHLDLEGDQADDIFNGVIVTYTDPAGTTRTVGPSGSGADATDSTLADTSATNPVNAHGIPKRYAQLEITPTTTQAGAIQMGAVFLAEKSLPQRRGQLTVSGQIQHPTAGKRSVAQVRAGDYVRISDHPTDVPRRIIETSYSHDAGEMTMSLDNSVFKLDAILERIGVSLTGVL